MSLWKPIAILLIGLALGIGIYDLKQDSDTLRVELDNLTATLTSLEDENQVLEEKIQYFQNPDNLLKELKSQFHYREQGEEMIIIVPQTEE